jgi:DHA2 family metal-tetracycline-proton antiporter-like MFS transporter
MSDVTACRAGELSEPLRDAPSTPLRVESTRLLIVLSGLVAVNAVLVSLINVSLPSVKSSFGVGPGELSWGISAYIMSGAIGTLVCGRLADVMGLERTMVLGLLVFAAVSLCLVGSTNFWVFVALRAPQGFMGMALPALATAAIVRWLPPADRNRGIGMSMAAFGLGLIAGSVGGGVATAIGGWRLPFLIDALFAVGLLLPVTRTLRGQRDAEARATTPPVSFDVGGAVLIAAAVGTTLLAINRLPINFRDVAGLLSAGLVVPLWIGFLRHIRHTSAPFIDPRILQNTKFLGVCALGASVQGMFVGAGFLLPLILSGVFHLSLAEVGLFLTPGFVALALSASRASRLYAAYGSELVLTVSAGGGTLCALVSVILGLPPQAWILSVVYVVLAAAYALTQPALVALAARHLPPEYTATGLGFSTFTYFAAGALAVALEGGIIAGRLAERHSWNPLFTGDGAAYVNAFVVVAGLAMLATTLLLGWVLPGARRTPLPATE